jgi:hypothetical protein
VTDFLYLKKKKCNLIPSNELMVKAITLAHRITPVVHLDATDVWLLVGVRNQERLAVQAVLLVVAGKMDRVVITTTRVMPSIVRNLKINNLTRRCPWMLRIVRNLPLMLPRPTPQPRRPARAAKCMTL